MKNKAVEIKRIGVDDAAQLSAVAMKAYSDHYLHLWHDGGAWYLNAYFTTARFREELRDADARFYLLYYTNEPVGFLKLNLNKPLPGESKAALELERIYLTAAASGNGIGTEALHFVFAIARAQKREVAWLKVMDSSAGPVAFYKKMGFEICGAYQLSFSAMKEALRGMYIMRKDL